MELHYDITKQDFIDFNLNYYNNNAIVQRSIRTMRIATAAIVILGGSALMYWLHTLTPVSIAVYVALAAVCFWGTPRYMRHKMIKNIEKILRNAKNKQLCGPKTLSLIHIYRAAQSRLLPAFEQVPCIMIIFAICKPPA